MTQKGVKIFCYTTQFPALPLFGPHAKAHGVWGFVNHDHMWLDMKLVYVTCAKHQITYTRFACTSMIDQLWPPFIAPLHKLRYQPVQYCTYWPVLGCFNNWNEIKFSNKTTTIEYFSEIHQVVIDGISNNILYLIESGKYG